MGTEERVPLEPELERAFRHSLVLRDRRQRRYAIARAIAHVVLVLLSLGALGTFYATHVQDSPLDTASAIDVVRHTVSRDFAHYVLDPLDEADGGGVRRLLVLPILGRFDVTSPSDVRQALTVLNVVATLIALGCASWLAIHLGTRRLNAWLLLVGLGTSPAIIALACSAAREPFSWAFAVLGMTLAVRSRSNPAGIYAHLGLTALLWLGFLEGITAFLLPLWCFASVCPGPSRRVRLAIFLSHVTCGLVVAGLLWSRPLASLPYSPWNQVALLLVPIAALALGAFARWIPFAGLLTCVLAAALQTSIVSTEGPRAAIYMLPVLWLVGARVARHLDRTFAWRGLRPGGMLLMVFIAVQLDDAWRLTRYLRRTEHVHAARARWLREDMQPEDLYVTTRSEEIPFLIALEVPYRVVSSPEELSSAYRGSQAARIVVPDSRGDVPFPAVMSASDPVRTPAFLDPTRFRQVFDPEARSLRLEDLSRTAPERLLVFEARRP